MKSTTSLESMLSKSSSSNDSNLSPQSFNSIPLIIRFEYLRDVDDMSVIVIACVLPQIANRIRYELTSIIRDPDPADNPSTPLLTTNPILDPHSVINGQTIPLCHTPSWINRQGTKCKHRRAVLYICF